MLPDVILAHERITSGHETKHYSTLGSSSYLA